MADLPPLNDDGELPFEAEYEKPKKRPPSRLWQKAYIPIPLLLAICALLICSALLFLSTSLTNGSLLCQIPSLCSDRTAAELLALVGHDPRPPFDQSRVERHSIFDPKTDTNQFFNVTVTPASYSMRHCDPNADYSNHLMFTMEAGDNAEIFVMGADGNGLCRVTDNLIEETQVDWSPDRKHIVFASQRSGDGATDIYEMNFDGTNIVNLTQDQRNDFGPVWSPDGKQIAYFSQDPSGPGGEIYVVSADGSNIRDLTPGAVGAREPTWSPDGTRIAYRAGAQSDPNKWQIFAVEVNTGKIEPLSSDSIGAREPTWSPDETTLFVTADVYADDGKYTGSEMFTLNAADRSLQPFPAIPYHFEGLTFSPQGDEIAYTDNNQIKLLDRQSMETRTLPMDHPVTSRISWR